MSLGARIEQRRLEIGISQAELARRVGVRQSTINGLIRGEQRSTTRLYEIARELNTSAAFLSGETDDPTGDSNNEGIGGYEERELLKCFGMLKKVDRAAVLQIVRTMAARFDDDDPGIVDRVDAPD